MATNTAVTSTTPSILSSPNEKGPYSIGFVYVNQSDVEVYVNGVKKSITTDYTFSSATQITFVANPTVSIEFRRNSDLTARSVDFNDGSVLTESDLDSNTNQILYAQQEIINDFATKTGTETLTNKTLTTPDINTPDIDGGTIDGATISSCTINNNVTGNLTGNVTGNVTGNTSGTAATVTGAAQSAITSVGTLTGLNVSGDLILDGASKDFSIRNGSGVEKFRVDSEDGDTTIQGTVTVTGQTNLNGNVLLGSADDDLILINGKVIQTILPLNTGVNLGSSSLRFGHFYGDDVDITGNITVGGTVDGRDVATDGSKLDGIDTGAKDDQTAAEIKTLLDSSGLVNAQIDASAAIALSKLATGALPTAITVTSANISDLSILNADVNASASIAGTKISPDFGSQNIVTTGTLGSGNITVSKNQPRIDLIDTNDDSDYYFINDNGVFAIKDSTNDAGRLVIAPNGLVTIYGNCDFSAGIDVTGDISVTGDIKVGTAAGTANQYLKKNSSNQLAWETVSPGSAGGANTIHMNDGVKITFGDTTTPDLEIHHVADGNSIIDCNTGDLILRSDADDLKLLAEDDILLRDNDDSTNFIHCVNGGAVKLYGFGASDPSFETTSAGAKVAANLVIDNAADAESVLRFYNTGVDSWMIQQVNTDNTLNFRRSSTNYFTLNASGDATFAGDISGVGITAAGGTGNRTGDAVIHITKENNNDYCLKADAGSNGSSNYGIIITTKDTTSHAFSVYNLDDSTTKLHIDGEGDLDTLGHLYVKGGGTANKFETTATGATVSNNLIVNETNTLNWNATSPGATTTLKIQNNTNNDNNATGIELRVQRGNGAAGIHYITNTATGTDYKSNLIFSRRTGSGNSDYAQTLTLGHDGVATFAGAVSVASKTVSQTATTVAALEIDCSAGNYFTKAITTSSTFTFAHVPANGTAYGFVIEIDVTGSSTAITWPNHASDSNNQTVHWPGGTAPTLTDTKTHVFTFATVDGGTTWRASSLVDYTT